MFAKSNCALTTPAVERVHCFSKTEEELHSALVPTVIDFAGGIVVHTIAGFAALASVIYVGKRRDKESVPNSIPLIAIGTGLLWFGWYGFNAGSALDVNAITGLAFLNTDVAASFAAITWLVIEWYLVKKPKFMV